jgi:iron-regulated transporter 1
MKQIDLSCKIAAPGISGLVLSQLAFQNDSGEATIPDLQKACLFIGIANAIALVVEYICTARIYSIVPDLAHKRPQSSSGTENYGATDLPFLSDEPTCAAAGSCCPPPGFGIYMMQPICWGGLGLSLLYANALTFGNGIMTAYLLHRGQKIEVVGALRGTASAIGLLGTFAYQLSAKYLSLETTGMWSITYQFCFMGLALMSVFIEQDSVAIALLVTGVCLSRIGLWVFDIAITQMQQQEIPEGVRGAMGGVQQSLNAFFTLLSFALGLVFPDPKDFVFFVMTAFFSVACALALYAFGVFVPRIRR